NVAFGADLRADVLYLRPDVAKRRVVCDAGIWGDRIGRILLLAAPQEPDGCDDRGKEDGSHHQALAGQGDEETRRPGARRTRRRGDPAGGGPGAPPFLLDFPGSVLPSPLCLFVSFSPCPLVPAPPPPAPSDTRPRASCRGAQNIQPGPCSPADGAGPFAGPC